MDARFATSHRTHSPRARGGGGKGREESKTRDTQLISPLSNILVICLYQDASSRFDGHFPQYPVTGKGGKKKRGAENEITLN